MRGVGGSGKSWKRGAAVAAARQQPGTCHPWRLVCRRTGTGGQHQELRRGRAQGQICIGLLLGGEARFTRSDAVPTFDCKTFREKIEEIAESLEKKAEESEETKSATDLLEKLNVGESKDEEGTKEAASASAEVEKDDSAQQEKPESDK
ncbi:hypothetical protein CK203_003571 [Vitis vinifera]|uniref:Uncharacterized protein n=1 Tax=Vitis vinifera TaxID=29760 RepID=A0A438K8Y9_VITVI|nr:hypothetical protein CK203_003571 [Vitis vinifera]